MKPTPPEIPASAQTVGALSPRPTRVRGIIFALACGMSFVLYLHRYSWGFIKPFVNMTN